MIVVSDMSLCINYGSSCMGVVSTLLFYQYTEAFVCVNKSSMKQNHYRLETP